MRRNNIPNSKPSPKRRTKTILMNQALFKPIKRDTPYIPHYHLSKNLGNNVASEKKMVSLQDNTRMRNSATRASVPREKRRGGWKRSEKGIVFLCRIKHRTLNPVGTSASWTRKRALLSVGQIAGLRRARYDLTAWDQGNPRPHGAIELPAATLVHVLCS